MPAFQVPSLALVKASCTATSTRFIIEVSTLPGCR